MRIGLVYDLFDAYPWEEGEAPDADAEYEPEETVQALEAGLRLLGHEPVRIGTAFDLLRRLADVKVDAAISIAEGARSRNREGYAPTLFEMAGLPFLGSDALTLSLSLDKAWTKDLAAAAGVATPAYRSFASAEEVTEEAIAELGLPGAENPSTTPVSPPVKEGTRAPSHKDHLPSRAALTYPLFVKPRYEGSSKGITAASRVKSLPELREQVRRVTEAYRQEALVEAFVQGGGEFTVAVIGNDPLEALPVLQRAVEASSRIGLHALERRGLAEQAYDYALEGSLTPELEAHLQALAARVYEKLQCKDFARVDFRVDAKGAPWFLEINPLPTFAPDGTFAIIAELMGRSYPDFLAHVLGRGLRRVGLQ